MPGLVDLETVAVFERIAGGDIQLVAGLWAIGMAFTYLYNFHLGDRIVLITFGFVSASRWLTRTLERPFRYLATSIFGRAPHPVQAKDLPLSDGRAWVGMVSLLIVLPILEELVFRAIPLFVAEQTGVSPIALVLIGTVIWLFRQGPSWVVGEIPLGLLFSALWLTGQGWLAIALRVVLPVAVILAIYVSRSGRELSQSHGGSAYDGTVRDSVLSGVRSCLATNGMYYVLVGSIWLLEFGC